MKKTMENLAKAFIGESQARNRYAFYAKAAKKEGFEQIAEIFLTTAENEKEHATWLFRLINELKEKSGEAEDNSIFWPKTATGNPNQTANLMKFLTSA